MKANHSEQFKFFQEKATTAKAAIEEAITTDDKKSRKRQLTMEDCNDQVKIWDTNDVRSQQIAINELSKSYQNSLKPMAQMLQS